MDLIVTILPVVTKDLPISPRFTPYNFLSRCNFSTLTTRQLMVEFYLHTFPRFPLRKKEHKSYFRTSRCADYLLDHSGDDVSLKPACAVSDDFVDFPPATTTFSLRLQSEASDALGLPHENGELNRALEELSALMNDLAEDLVESPSHRRALLRTALPKLLGAMLFRTYDGEPERVFLAVEEALQGVARALAKVLLTCRLL